MITVNILNELRNAFIASLWKAYLAQNPQMQKVLNGFSNLNLNTIYLDHFAIIDLPGDNSGIKVLEKIFQQLDFVVRGRDYLPSKINDFAWLCEKNANTMLVKHVQPQIVIADFRLAEMPSMIRNIIEKYTRYTKPFPEALLKEQLRLDQQNNKLSEKTLSYLTHFFLERSWPLPTCQEFNTVAAFNELLAWVLVFGRIPNHFTLAMHLFDHFPNLSALNDYVIHELELPLNTTGGIIKGNKETGLQQSSTKESRIVVSLADGEVSLPHGFVEFVWRFPHAHGMQKTPIYFGDYFTGFISQQADHVIESLYVNH